MKKPRFAVLALLILAACDSTIFNDVCSLPVAYSSAQVTAVDSVTGVNVTGGSTVVLSNAENTDSIPVPAEFLGVSIGGHTGTFTLRVRRAGYDLWEKTGIKVEPGECGGPRTVQVTAKLQPTGPSPQ
ncbi:MAG TPA: hypothetical protein VFS20_26600 [Longimicrobium sp.]|nr:hypothetical protein [Longimicrobium sp.]